ncbi:outer membrane beta-barrel protein [Mucilaginibacter sp.]|uniref:outer membrane beta-barrel protein n=1 Tax=Mucilaginibacter sp. TaxID=1882438 RepID=UPI0025EF1545|nr:outer membrane beta-barrel protein [Mucilaginibacter sp.]
MRKLLLAFCGFLLAVSVNAQSIKSFAQFGVGIDGGSTLGYTDLKRQNPGYSAAFHFNYNFSPYFPISLELQHGQLSGGGSTLALDSNLRKYKNNYTALVLRADIQLGELLDYDSDILDPIKGIFVGFGVGGINNQVITNRIKPDGSHYMFPGLDHSREFIASGRIGYALRIYNGFDEPQFVITFCYIHTFDIGDNLDGYNDPVSKFKNQDTDHYRQISVGITYNFGHIQPYYKERSYRRRN